MSENGVNEVSTNRIKKGSITHIAKQFNELDSKTDVITATKLAAREYGNIKREIINQKINGNGRDNDYSEFNIPTGEEIRDDLLKGEFREMLDR